MKRFLLWVVGVILGVAVLLGAVMTVSYSFPARFPPGGRHAVRRAGAGSERLLLAGAAAGRRVR